MIVMAVFVRYRSPGQFYFLLCGLDRRVFNRCQRPQRGRPKSFELEILFHFFVYRQRHTVDSFRLTTVITELTK